MVLLFNLDGYTSGKEASDVTVVAEKVAESASGKEAEVVHAAGNGWKPVGQKGISNPKKEEVSDGEFQVSSRLLTTLSSCWSKRDLKSQKRRKTDSDFKTCKRTPLPFEHSKLLTNKYK
jgi:hypothetical protein